MPVYSKTVYFLILSLFSATLTGCSTLGVAEEMLTPIFSQEYSFPEQSQNVWQTVSDIVDSHITRSKGDVLVRDSNNHTISWIERLGTKLEKHEKIANYNKSDKIKPPHENEVLEVGKGGIAITTVCIRNSRNGSLMRIRRVYYGQLTQPRMVHSRGVFANHFQELVNKELSINAGNKTL